MAAGTSCLKLAVVNFNYTAVTPVSLVPLLKGCSELTVLKLAGIQNWVSFHIHPFVQFSRPTFG